MVLFYNYTTDINILNSSLNQASIYTSGTISVAKDQYLIVSIANTSRNESIFSTDTAIIQMINSESSGSNMNYSTQLITTIYKVVSSGNVILTPYYNSVNGHSCEIVMVVI